jgi:hypothetical protein
MDASYYRLLLHLHHRVLAFLRRKSGLIFFREAGNTYYLSRFESGGVEIWKKSQISWRKRSDLFFKVPLSGGFIFDMECNTKMQQTH